MKVRIRLYAYCCVTDKVAYLNASTRHLVFSPMTGDFHVTLLFFCHAVTLSVKLYRLMMVDSNANESYKDLSDNAYAFMNLMVYRPMPFSVVLHSARSVLNIVWEFIYSVDRLM